LKVSSKRYILISYPNTFNSSVFTAIFLDLFHGASSVWVRFRQDYLLLQLALFHVRKSQRVVFAIKNVSHRVCVSVLLCVLCVAAAVKWTLAHTCVPKNTLLTPKWTCSPCLWADKKQLTNICGSGNWL